MRVDQGPIRVTENLVAPLSMLEANAYGESQDGLSVAELKLVAGQEWSSRAGWQWKAAATVTLERVLLALNDRPLSLILEATATAPQRQDEREFTGLVGARFSVFSARRAAFSNLVPNARVSR